MLLNFKQIQYDKVYLLQKYMYMYTFAGLYNIEASKQVYTLFQNPNCISL